MHWRVFDVILELAVLRWDTSHVYDRQVRRLSNSIFGLVMSGTNVICGI